MYTYKYRLKPTEEQKILLDKHFGCCRYVYNHFLGQRIKNYKEKQKSSNYFEDANQLPTLKKKFPWLKEVGSQSLQQVLKNLQNSHENFFRSVKSGKRKPGFPRFKSKHGKQSFRVPQAVKLLGKKIFLPKFREGIELVYHRELKGVIKSATVSKTAAGYFVSILTDCPILELPPVSGSLGIDLNVKGVVDSSGKKTPNPRPGSVHSARLRLLSKAVSRAKKGSKNREKAKKKLAKFQNYCQNIREDHLHKVSRRIINENQVICVEDLNMKSMTTKGNGSRKLRRDLQDCSFASLLNKLEYKARRYGRTLVKVDRWFPSSQLCSECGWRYHNLPGGCKSWTCQECQAVHDRDINAAKNILKEGLRTLTSGTEGIAHCPDVRPT